MAITTMDQLVSGLTVGFRSPFYKAQAAAGGLASFWRYGGIPGIGAIPPTGVGEAPTEATLGALYFVNPTGGAFSYLASAEFAEASQAGTTYLYDRLVHTSGLSGTVTTSQTVNSVAITRPDSLGAGTDLFIECFTSVGGTASNATIIYTNQSGTSGRTAVVSVGNMSLGNLQLVSLASGDTGVRSVQSVTLSASTGVAGNLGIVIGRRIAILPASNANGSGFVGATVQDAFALGLPQLYDHSCLWMIGGYGSGFVGPITGMLGIAQG